MTNLDTTAIDHVLTTTRSVRKRLDTSRPVPRAVLLECLELAIQAPTGQNGQGWRWVIVTDPVKRASLASLYNASNRYLEANLAQEKDPQTRRVYESSRHLGQVLADVPVHIIPCVRGRFENSPNITTASFYGSIIPATWSLMLALRSRGLGAAWTTQHLFKEEEAAEVLGIPYGEVTQVALLPVAYTVGSEFRPAVRLPAERVAYWNTWGSAIEP